MVPVDLRQMGMEHLERGVMAELQAKQAIIQVAEGALLLLAAMAQAIHPLVFQAMAVLAQLRLYLVHL